MKTLAFISKSIMCVAFTVVTLSLSAQNSDANYKWVDSMENGKMVSREIMKETSQGKYQPTHKYEFAYNENGEIATKEIYAWDQQRNKWRIQSITKLTYDDSLVVMEVSKWANPEKKSPTIEKMVFGKNQQDEYVINYIMEKKSDKWVLKSDNFLTNK